MAYLKNLKKSSHFSWISEEWKGETERESRIRVDGTEKAGHSFL